MAKTPRESWGISYGQLVSREFFKNRLNVASLIFIIFLFVLAIFAPFLANDKPYAMQIDGKWSFPLFRSVEPFDYAVLLAAAVGVVMFSLIRSNQKNIEP